MDPFKLMGGALIALGLVFRAICKADFQRRLRRLPDDPQAQRQLVRQQQRALLIDYGFIAAGVYTLLTH